MRDLRGNGLHAGSRLLERHPGLHPRDDLQPVIVAGALTRPEGEGTPDLGPPAIEGAVGGQHADDGERLTVEDDRAPDDAAIGREQGLPRAIRQDHDLIAPRLLVFRQKRPPEHGADAEHPEVAGRHPPDANARRLARSCQRHRR